MLQRIPIAPASRPYPHERFFELADAETLQSAGNRRTAIEAVLALYDAGASR